MKGAIVAAATTEIAADDSMVISGGIHPRFASRQEGKLRASAVIIEKGIKAVIVSCDVLMLQRDTLDDACRKIYEATGIPFENILITASHTHHAPSTVTVHGYERDEKFCENVKGAIISAVVAAEKKLGGADEVEARHWLGNEATVGQNSRLLLQDGTVYWVGPREDALRPTGPFDPDLPVVSFKGRDGALGAILFCHSTHNIGTLSGESRSPGFYGLASQQLEEKLGAPVIFMPGAFGSTHNLTLSAEEMVLRIKGAIEEALSESKPVGVPCIASAKKEFEYRVREFDERAEDEAVSHYCEKRLVDKSTIDIFRKMRGELAEHQGERRRSWLQAILLGEIALVGVPGELFTKLGIRIKRLSPFRHTYVISLANDYIGYIPDEGAFALGGYQLWTGLHSFVERGTGEAIVEEAVKMLSDLQ